MSDPSAILQRAAEFLANCDHWALLSKTCAVLLGIVISAAGALITSKRLSDKWHYGLCAAAAACVSTWTLLRPYEEYKQFRDAYAVVEHAELRYRDTGSQEDLKGLEDAIFEGHKILKEDWPVPEFKVK